VHGPPGTGKSQTIVNIIADALAHNRTVLMVCQKQAATRVVLERLRAVGLDSLCQEVHDAAANRQEVFTKIRRQLDMLRDRPSKAEETRTHLSHQIVEKERFLDEHARALYQQHPRIGLSYREILAREGRLQVKYPTLRELPSLQNVLGTWTEKEVRQLCPQVQTLGQLFRLANAPNNPWRDR
jgi:primosomal replication protein N''